MSERPLIEIRNLRKWFPIKSGWATTVKSYVRAVDGVDLSVMRGETLGIVGESGCGKTTLGRVLMGLIPITNGSVIYDGEDIRKIPNRDLRRRLQIVFQDPGGSMNPRMSVRSIVGEPLQVNGMAEGAELTQRVAELLDSVGLKRQHMNRFPHEFSGGQKQRIALARALSMDPEFILLDEPTSALDVSVQAQVLNLLGEIQRKRDLTFVFIAHDLAVVRHISDRVAVMYLGKIVELADAEEIYRNPRHAYTKALISAIPRPDPEAPRNQNPVEGDVPSPVDPPPGCAFGHRLNHPKWEQSIDMDLSLREISPGHWVQPCPCCTNEVV
ncbi:MAG: oligopeptide/dipeptide ABC transporter ATP-binding protein [Candidatus Thermoplasmatota archaeon]|nr:oligopeptide/dipeptide ABC transporter ATP-binding protein [Candidatus Thermoplasmatota archaeon]MED5274368.1 oligopeptide/dipeptide ABC transporter ATP-binding protein [Candidatus Thermoplasmatota archaeon]